MNTEQSKSEEEMLKNLSYSRIAEALSRDYFSIYYVDMETDRFVEYSSDSRYKELKVEQSGEDFFETSRRNIERLVYPDDIDKALTVFNKTYLEKAMKRDGSFSTIYRLMFDGVPVYISIKAILMDDEDGRHMIIGVSNIDAQMKRQEELEAAQQKNLTFASISQALAMDYFSIYYVNTKTDQFIEYSSHEDYKDLNIEQGGEDFFNLSRENILRVVYPEDHDKLLTSFTKENILKELADHHTFTLNYRLMFGDKPTYVSMKATRLADEDDPHIVIGVNNIDAQMRRQEAYERAREESLTYTRIAQALFQDYFTVYYVDIETEHFTEYNTRSEYRNLELERTGEGFFEDCRRNIMKLVYPEDREIALSVFDKENLLKSVSGGKPFIISYRLMFDGVPTYVNIKALRLSGPDDKHIIIGVSNVDEQKKMEQEYKQQIQSAQEIANRDPLTGVKSKHAYTEAEQELDKKIAAGNVDSFAVVVCDVNGLKSVNDTLGHKAGDEFIRNACGIICEIFKHSPVYRIGGDEFAVLMRGQDYEHRETLFAELDRVVRHNNETGGIVIASGISDFDAADDKNVVSVFERADAAMYENKRELKEIRED